MTDFIPADQPERDAALDPERSVIVQAPAGSGKTGLLTQRYLRLLALVEQPEEIVAITFTRKAAAEMRERILSAMRAASRGVQPDNANLNERRTHELAVAALARDAEADWDLLGNPARLRIMTIDAFNAMLTRQMPVTSQFGQQPGIAEDGMDTCREAAHRLLEMIDEKTGPGPALRILLAHLDNRLDQATELVAMMLARRDLWLRHLDVHGLDRAVLEANLADEVSAALRALEAALPAELVDEAMRIARRCREYLLAGEAVAAKNEWVVELGSMAASPLGDACDLSAWKLLRKFLLTDEGNPRRTAGLNINSGFPAKNAKFLKKGQADRHKNEMGELLDALAGAPLAITLLKQVDRLPLPRYTDEQWQVLDAINTLLPHAVVCLQERFRDTGEVDFAELAIRARDALGDDDNPTDLAMRLDYRVRHLLVDEFQDTSHSQIDLLLRLTRGWEPGDGRSLFLVGDPMQSIYAFREAEVGHFLAVRDHGLGPLQLESLRLSANFRSQAGVVDWVNDAFGDEAAAIFPQHDRPTVGAIAYEASEPTRERLPDDAVSVHAFAQREFEQEAARVIELVKKGLEDPGNETTAILVRGRNHLAAILPALRDASIPFRAVELESLERQPEIQDLLALTRAVVNPADRTALYSVCRAPWCGMSLAGLQALSRATSQPWQALLDANWRERELPENDARIARLADALRNAWRLRGRYGLRESVESAWLAVGGPAVLRAADERDNTALFFELLQQLEEAGDLDDVNALDERLVSLYAAPDPDAPDSVQLMTLHKAKGLQFDTVIIPALDQVPKKKDQLLFHWIERPGPHGEDRVLLGPLRAPDEDARGESGAIYRFIEQLREEKADFELARLLYVGITRAKRHVHLLGKARFNRGNGVAELGRPPKGSLLAMLWPLPGVRAAFEALPLPRDDEHVGEEHRESALLRRVAADWALPEISAGPELDVRVTDIASAERIVYDWAGDRVRHTGTLVHRILQRICEDGLAQWNAERVAALPLERRLRAMGLPEADCPGAARDAHEALRRVLASAQGRWLLAEHEGARSEWSLGGVDRGERVSVSIDRSFIDEQGTRWIIDYKTSKHEGGDVEKFLAGQRERYREQLERYARLVHALDGRPVKVALYFPLQDAFHAWEPALDRDLY